MTPKKSKKSGRNSLKNITPRLYELMVEEKLSELTWEEKDSFKIKIKRKSAYASATGPAPSVPAAKKKEKKKEEASYIRSPMNGIFYEAAQPGAEPFVKKGMEIKPDTTVCIIEAMKLMNEVKVEKPAVIEEVMVKNAESVQINQPLFKITDM